MRKSSAVLAAGLGVILTTAVVAVVTSDETNNAAVSAAAGADTSWNIARSSTYSGSSQISDITATPDGGMWSVGNLTTQQQPLVERLTPQGWTRLAIPASMHNVRPTVIGASSAANVWLGGTQTTTGDNRLLRWNGSSWSSIPIKNAFSLYGLAVLSAQNVWAISTSQTSPTPHAQQWNGTSWRDHTLGITPRAIGASSPSNVWVVGLAAGQPAVTRWNGSAWSTVPFPEIPGIVSSEMAPAFRDVQVISDRDVWAVGSIPVKDSTGKLTTRSLFAHWDGSDWSTQLGANGTGYTEIEQDGAGGLWLRHGTVMRHRTAGGVWTTENLAVPTGKKGTVYGLALQPGTKTVWAVGLTQPGRESSFDGVYWRNND
ncbi:hypothetical protein [Actinomadura alba]|uniref:Uncharacterized protein n=1 Tax=Actinomadura alba TaxID=406431 RepID=A0ABR7M0T7_9ACTN|nr:hypothetical protein [Actinomadura alba]MBC6470732.1 hypothetical protein [Actinomadura alba]